MHDRIVTTARKLCELCVAVVTVPEERQESCRCWKDILQTDALCKLSLSKQKTEERQDQVPGPAMLFCGLRELKSKEG